MRAQSGGAMFRRATEGGEDPPRRAGRRASNGIIFEGKSG